MLIKDKQKQFIRDMRRAGLPYSGIANVTGLSQNTVKSFCRRENIYIMGASDKEKGDICKYCGMRLTHCPGRKKKRFCSDKCRSDWWNHNRGWVHGKKSHMLLCHCCGAEFESYGNKNRKYCSRECYIQSRYGEGLP